MSTIKAYTMGTGKVLMKIYIYKLNRQLGIRLSFNIYVINVLFIFILYTLYRYHNLLSNINL